MKSRVRAAGIVMIHAVSMLALVVVGTTAKAKAGPPAEAELQPARQIVVDENNAGKVHHIRTARGVVTTVEFLRRKREFEANRSLVFLFQGLLAVGDCG
jgi:hypothetical protein